MYYGQKLIWNQTSNKLVAEYPFDGNSNDVSGNSLNGTNNANISYISNTVVIPTNGRIDVGNNDLLFLKDGFTIEFDMLVNWSSVPSNLAIVLNKYSKVLGAEKLQYFIGFMSGNFRIFVGDGNGITNYIQYDISYNSLGISPTTLSNFKITYDGGNSSASINLYVNGVKKTLSYSMIGTFTKITHNLTNLVIGNAGWETTNIRGLNGRLDNLKIYDYVR